MASSAAKRYAQALFSLGKERNTLDAWQSDLALLASLARDASIATYLDNPSITAEQKMAKHELISTAALALADRN